MKPTIINILFGLALMFGKFFTEEPILKKILGIETLEYRIRILERKNYWREKYK